MPSLPLAFAAIILACAVGVGPGTVEGPAARSLATLASQLGAAANGTVLPSDVRWERSSGVVVDFLLGRRVLFLASATAGAPRDLYRARARLSPEGSVLGIFGVKNLTATPLGDDHALVLDGDQAAFATFAYGQEQTVTWLNLSGERGASPIADLGLGDRITEYITRWSESGSGQGIGRVEVSLTPPARAVGLALVPASHALQIDLIDQHGVRSSARLDGDRDELSAGPVGLHAEAVRRLPKRFVLWAVDTVRSSVGTAPIAWLEEHVFAAKDSFRRFAFEGFGRGGASQDTLAEANDHLVVQAAVGEPLDASKGEDDRVVWPPPAVGSIWKTKEPGEGEWLEPRLPWNLKREASPPPEGAVPPAFYRTFVRPDPDRPYARVILVAMDLRQLDLAMEAGTEDPKPLTGGHGPGRIPRDPAVASRVVAAFNGGFKTEHGNYGMMVNRRILLPPQPNAATVVVLDDRRVGFGTWGGTWGETWGGSSGDTRGPLGVTAENIVSFRQNLDPLVDRGEVNPMGRALWGYTLPGSGMQTERSGIGVTDAGHVVYAWGDDVSGTTLGKALKLAGCNYAIHLDMNPHHTGFIFSKISELKGHNYRSELLTPLMTVSPDRYIEYAPKDFFYVMTRDATPPPVDDAIFHPDPGAQPPPSWAPAIWSAMTSSNEARVELTRLDPGRLRFHIRAGAKEPDAKTGASPLRELDADDMHRVVMTLGLGHALEKRPRGLATDGRLSYPMRRFAEGGDGADASAALVADEGGGLAIVRSQDVTAVGAHVDLAELPLLAVEGVVAADARRTFPVVNRGALGLLPDGTVLVARGAVDSDATLALVLVRAGCRRVVALDRGVRAVPLLLRSGTSSPPRGRADDTSLYVLATPMKPRAFRFDAGTAVAAGDRVK